MDPAMLVAITGFIVGVGGLLLNLRGVRDQNRQQAAAEQALEAKSRLDETQQIIDGQASALGAAFTREQQHLARITQRSAHRLEIRPGLALCAQIKSVALLG